MKIIRLEETESTNSYAKSHIEELSDFDVIHALRQTKGRGRLNRTWVDLGQNNLFFSIILKPSTKFNSIYSNITQYASVKLCQIFEKYGLKAQIKWPNDVMIDGQRKISGILSETVIESGILKGIILGIGINLSASKSGVESIPDRIVTALNLEIGQEVNNECFLKEFLDLFFKDYKIFLQNGFEYIKKDYIERNCFLDRDLNVQVMNVIKSGYAKDINSCGELILQTIDDKDLILNIGDIL